MTETEQEFTKENIQRVINVALAVQGLEESIVTIEEARTELTRLSRSSAFWLRRLANAALMLKPREETPPGDDFRVDMMRYTVMLTWADYYKTKRNARRVATQGGKDET